MSRNSPRNSVSYSADVFSQKPLIIIRWSAPRRIGMRIAKTATIFNIWNNIFIISNRSLSQRVRLIMKGQRISPLSTKNYIWSTISRACIMRLMPTISMNDTSFQKFKDRKDEIRYIFFRFIHAVHAVTSDPQARSEWPKSNLILRYLAYRTYSSPCFHM